MYCFNIRRQSQWCNLLFSSLFLQARLSIWGWGSLGGVLFLITFGPFAIFYFAFYILCFVGGGFVVTLLFGKITSEKYLEKCELSFLPQTSAGISRPPDPSAVVTDAPRALRSQECIALSRDDDVAVLRDQYIIISRDSSMDRLPECRERERPVVDPRGRQTTLASDARKRYKLHFSCVRFRQKTTHASQKNAFLRAFLRAFARVFPCVARCVADAGRRNASVLEEMKREAKPIKIDRRVTGANMIDEPLQQVIQFSLRDYIQYWYYTLSEDESFLLEIRQTVQNALVQFSTRSKEIDWQPYFTTRLVDDFATHLRVFRKAQQRMAEKEDQKKDTAEDFVDTFFEVEVEMEKIVCRDLVCTSSKDEEGFLKDLCEVLLYLLLPPGDFQNKIMRYFAREILSRGILLPLINQLSDPDYINQYIIWMIRDSNCNYEAFMNVIKLSDNIGELEAVRDKAAEELQYLRSLDTVGEGYQCPSSLLKSHTAQDMLQLSVSGECAYLDFSLNCSVVELYSSIDCIVATDRPLAYYRYIDDILIIWTESEPQLKTFHEQFNQSHPTINLTLNYSCTEINFLDTIIKLQNNKIETSLYQKPIDRPTYLKWDSFHPKHIKNSVSDGLAVDNNRICSNPIDRDEHLGRLRKTFLNQGYHPRTIENQITRATRISRNHLLHYKAKEENNRVPLVVTYNPNLEVLRGAAWKLHLYCKKMPAIQSIFPDPPLLCFRQP
ncbi:unnamed protein product [Ranitomeya imitator]|uniref:PXA domain-containing protein n=1 Tax=Ranitomeya imitator TaxID=111125 RepID=A0ABN9MQ84_9NEOB|nr:unnamed protein product [Ranitomeya imitator]